MPQRGFPAGNDLWQSRRNEKQKGREENLPALLFQTESRFS
jgi:hypothetical protein